MRPIYLDNNATTRTDPAVVAAMLPFFSDQFGNASSSHAFGSEVAGAVKQARKSLQALLGAAFDHEIVFTSGGTESDNAAILSGARQRGRVATRSSPRRSSIPRSCRSSIICESARGIKVHLIGVDAQGRLDIDAYRRALGPRTAIASVMWANNETGTLFPVEQLAEMAHEAGALFHTDAVQAVGKIPLDLKTTQIDMLSLSGHKLHGPKGIGALYLRKGTQVQSVDSRRPSGTAAARRHRECAGDRRTGQGRRTGDCACRTSRPCRALRDRLERGVLSIGQCMVFGDVENRLPNTSNIAFDISKAKPSCTI